MLLDRSLDKKGREKHLLHFVAVMKVRMYVNKFNATRVLVVKIQYVPVCVCVCLCVLGCVCVCVCLSVCVCIHIHHSVALSVLPLLCCSCSMQCLRDFNNFNSFLCILSAIESASVSRLDWSDKVNKVSQ